MRHTLKNHRLEIAVEHTGAELSSLIDLASGTEYMWQADPKVWGSHAPVLFPIIGTLKGGETEIDGQMYAIPKHGIIRRNEAMETFSKSEDRVTLRLCPDNGQLDVYPYRADFRVTYRLRNEHVIVYHEVINDDDKPIHFCLGGHPAFRIPTRAGERYEDYFLRFENAEDSWSYTVGPEGTLTREKRPVPWEAGNVLPLTHELFANDALVFDDLKSASVVLESRLSGPVLKVDYAGWTHLGIWAKPDGDFVCIEPWMGLSDFHDSDQQFTSKEGIIELAPGETYEMSYDIKVLGLVL